MRFFFQKWGMFLWNRIWLWSLDQEIKVCFLIFFFFFVSLNYLFILKQYFFSTIDLRQFLLKNQEETDSCSLTGRFAPNHHYSFEIHLGCSVEIRQSKSINRIIIHSFLVGVKQWHKLNILMKFFCQLFGWLDFMAYQPL